MLQEGGPVLVCVSGGADSVALLDVLLRAGYACSVAHCNFHLRGAESDRDEAFVRQTATALYERLRFKTFPLQLYVTDFDTRTYAREHAVSIETAARELRYRWFEQTAVTCGAEAIAVAHHINDQAETVLMHIRRGCGRQGLQGMQPKSVNPLGGTVPIIRPLLCTDRAYIRHYLRDIRHIDWVEDSTNSDTQYFRNKVRAELASWSPAEIEHLATLGERI